MHPHKLLLVARRKVHAGALSGSDQYTGMTMTISRASRTKPASFCFLTYFDSAARSRAATLEESLECAFPRRRARARLRRGSARVGTIFNVALDEAEFKESLFPSARQARSECSNFFCTGAEYTYIRHIYLPQDILSCDFFTDYDAAALLSH